MDESTRDFALLVERCLEPIEGFSMKPMMGVYVMHCLGKVLGFVMDGYILLEDGPTARRLLPDNERAPLFPGSKDFVVVRDIGNAARLREVCTAIYDDLPVSKPRKSDRKAREKAASSSKSCKKSSAKSKVDGGDGQKKNGSKTIAKSSWKDRFED